MERMIMDCDPGHDVAVALVLAHRAWRVPGSRPSGVASLDELLGVADYLTLHVGLNAETRHLRDERRIARLKPGCSVLNTSSGG